MFQVVWSVLSVHWSICQPDVTGCKESWAVFEKADSTGLIEIWHLQTLGHNVLEV